VRSEALVLAERVADRRDRLVAVHLPPHAVY
jgi:hypothetical protein